MVTDARGYVGGTLAERLSAEGHRLRLVACAPIARLVDKQMEYVAARFDDVSKAYRLEARSRLAERNPRLFRTRLGCVAKFWHAERGGIVRS
jgi:nucleoside-diphosphate-sugar epimerase